MLAPSTTRRIGIAVLLAALAGVLLAALAGTELAHAQPTGTDTPVTTLADQPGGEGSQLSTEEADKRARTLFQQGRSAFEEGRYRDAWDYFRRAYLLSKRPELLYNVGQSADRMRMDREALEAFRLYLKRLPDAPNRREVENRIRALEEHPSTGASAGAASTTTSENTTGSASTGAGASSTTATINTNESAAPSLYSNPEPPPPPPLDTGQPGRKGLYVRLGLGLGFISDAVHGGGSDVTISSGTLAPHGLIGYEVASGVVIGGGLLFDWSLAPSLHSGSSKGVDIDAPNLSMIAAFVDYYFAPRSDGWHILGGLGIGWLSLSDPSGKVNRNAGGAELIGGGGYEWPIDREWALGVLGRLVIARMGAGGTGHTIFAPTISGSATWY